MRSVVRTSALPERSPEYGTPRARRPLRLENSPGFEQPLEIFVAVVLERDRPALGPAGDPDLGREALDLFTGAEIKSLTAKVADFCVKQEITASPPKVGYGTKADAAGVNLRLDPSYIKLAQEKK